MPWPASSTTERFGVSFGAQFHCVLWLHTGCRPADRPRDRPSNRQAGWVDSARIANSQREPENWFMAGGGPQEQYYSPLDQIDAGNVAQLGFAWEYTANSPRGRVQHGMHATPIVVDGRMFVSGPWSVAYSLDAATGKELWRYDPKVDGSIARRACCGVSSRGVQVWKGKVYLATLDGYLIALDASTGTELWRQDTFIDRDADYTITSAPHIAGTKVVVGNSVRISASVATSPHSTQRLVPSPGDSSPFLATQRRALSIPSSKLRRRLGTRTRPGTPVSAARCGAGWPRPRTRPAVHRHRKLVTLSDLVSKPARRRQSVSHVNRCAAILDRTNGVVLPDGAGRIWDYTATANLVLADLELSGVRRRVLMTAPKNGFYYVLDRATGEFLSAEKFVRVNWASHIDRATGRPAISKDALVPA